MHRRISRYRHSKHKKIAESVDATRYFQLQTVHFCEKKEIGVQG